LRWRFDTSGGPGGQHANRSATRVELAWDLGASPSVPARLRHLLLEGLGRRAPGGIVTVVAADSRSQWRNRAVARQRLAELLTEAMRRDPTRVATRVPASARRRRLDRKRQRSATKRLRQAPDEKD
jgi:ribosome-associated protein